MARAAETNVSVYSFPVRRIILHDQNFSGTIYGESVNCDRPACKYTSRRESNLELKSTHVPLGSEHMG
jgi:hypothetical protein